ncbi:glycoside hydrolase/phage tail family protein [uncultured Jannaschia sp.]|uniref:baseplate multidomain protein megatron n=1 Tax=uncultured Jannaschia sp. TaxID=293347 RepID=UPI00261EC6F1|nr:glycoside hydrolase/phage tail family protein [uncultured Jannaschia sp.]
MATLVLGAVGAAIGGSLGGSVFGVSAAVIGRAVGATVGRLVDQSIMGAGSEAVEHGRVDRFRLTGASEGAAIPRVIGRVRTGGHVIWATRFKEHRTTSGGGGGKGAPKAPQSTSFTYSVSLAMALCEGEIRRVGRIWADGTELARDSVQMRVHRGAEDQLPDSLIEAIEGAGAAPAYRGTAYVVFEDLDLTPFGNRVPNLSFEVVRHVEAEGEVPSPAELIEGVALVPGTGEYALATTAVHYDHGGGSKDSANVNTEQGVADFNVALTDLVEELPRVRSASLVVSWFGNDLRCGSCKVRPRAEQNLSEGTPMTWRVAGLDRAAAGVVPELEGRPVYGGTPADAAVIEAIEGAAAQGLDVTFYPFILMDQLAGNGLPDPWGGTEQGALPWRGRITTDLAPGVDGSSDGTAAAEAEVAAFFGTATAAEFSVRTLWGGQRVIDGPSENSYRRFILHYAALCAAAGGVEAFCIGSEMRALTQIRGADGRFPAVEQMIALAHEVRLLLPDAQIGYAADWTEYFGYQPTGTADLRYHLDPLWASDAIDFVGIDNYMPMSDWRASDGHADAEAGGVHDLGYLRSNIEGGEGFDWYYGSPEARAAQRRDPITDGAFGEPWVWRYKDIRSWWGKPHHERVDGLRSDEPTAWIPQSKPIRFTEYGCAAIDKGANQPNRFVDPKSSESGLPHYSDGRRDDAMQMQYLRAFLSHWSAPGVNALSDVDGRPMVDLGHSFAWAWDTRPWPAFPELSDYWSDGANHARGHWISGRSAAQPLATVIKAICLRAGVRAVDVSGVHGVVRGYAIDQVQSGRADLQPLLLAHGIEAHEAGGRLVFTMRARAPVHDVVTDLLVREADAPVVGLNRAPETEVSGRVRVTHVDAGGSFEVRVGDAAQPGDAPVPVAETELPLMLTRGEGHALAERFLAEGRVARDELSVILPPSRREVSAGDLLRLDGSGDLWRVDRLEDRGARAVTAIRTERGLYEPSDAVEDGSGRARPLAPLPVEALILDLPQLTSAGSPHAPHAAIAARPWPGSVAIHSSIEDAGYRLDEMIDVPSIIGTTETVMAPARPGLWDEGDALHLRLPVGALASASEAAVLAGANAAAIGDGAAGGWEVFQFREARLVAPQVWALSGRLRGQRGTERQMREPWPIGSRVVMLDGGPVQLDLPQEALGLERHYRIGPSRFSYDHESYVHRQVTVVGEGLRPFAPVHLQLGEEDGTDVVSWIRRSRSFVDGWGEAGVPLAERRETYDVRLLDSLGGDVATATVHTPRWVVPMGAVVPGSAQVVEVRQVSEEFGPGHPARLTLA